MATMYGLVLGFGMEFCAWFFKWNISSSSFPSCSSWLPTISVMKPTLSNYKQIKYICESAFFHSQPSCTFVRFAQQYLKHFHLGLNISKPFVQQQAFFLHPLSLPLSEGHQVHLEMWIKISKSPLSLILPLIYTAMHSPLWLGALPPCAKELLYVALCCCDPVETDTHIGFWLAS